MLLLSEVRRDGGQEVYAGLDDGVADFISGRFEGCLVWIVPRLLPNAYSSGL